MQKFPWTRCFQIAMALGLAPDKIWQMTPGELTMALHQRSQTVASSALNQHELAEILSQFPDQTCQQERPHG